MKGWLWAIGGLILAPSAVFGQEAKDTSYFCVTEASGGLHYNEKSKQWQGATFRPTHKFVLKLRFVGTKPDLITKAPITDYKVTVTDSGSNMAAECLGLHGIGGTVEVWPDGELRCLSIGGYEYVFGFKTNRFLEMYTYGYVSGKDNNDDNPTVGGGTCTKID